MGGVLFLVITTLVVVIAFYHHKKNKAQVELEALEKEEQRQYLMAKRHLEEQDRLKKEHDNKKYNIQTHKVKYLLYSHDFKQSNLIYLYEGIVEENLWINEPFYSKFYQILLMFDKNELMIINPKSKVITIDMRDHNNKMSKSKSYEVFSSIEILENVLKKVKNRILMFNKSDAQNITLVICIIVLQKSTHYLQLEEPLDMVEKILLNYKDLKSILSMIDKRDEQLLFINKAFEQVFLYAETYPFNDYGLEQVQLQIDLKLPQKRLRQI